MTERNCENCAEYTADGWCLEHAEPLDGPEWCTGWKESTTNIGLGGTIKTGVIKDGATALGLDKPRKLNHGERMNNQTLRACINCK